MYDGLREERKYPGRVSEDVVHSSIDTVYAAVVTDLEKNERKYLGS